MNPSRFVQIQLFLIFAMNRKTWRYPIDLLELSNVSSVILGQIVDVGNMDFIQAYRQLNKS